MKKVHIIAIILIAAAIGVILTTLSDSSTYATFSQAAKEPDIEFHIVGKLNKEKETIYDPHNDPNKFVFYMMDNEGVEKKVVLFKNKPQDFERSEQIVLIGRAQQDEFHASEILLKCPSKYNDGSPEGMVNSSVNQ